jgi:hypothetical protein
MKTWKIAGIALIVVIAATLMTGSLVFARSSNQEAVEQTVPEQEGGERQGRAPGRSGQREARLPRLDVVAEALGMTVEELQAEFEAGKKLPDILEELGMSEEDLQAALQAARVARIEQAVSDGELTQEQADEILERTREKELVQDARQAMREAEIEQALSDGIITQEQADLLLELGDKGSPGTGAGGMGSGRPGGNVGGGRPGPGGGAQQGEGPLSGGD